MGSLVPDTGLYMTRYERALITDFPRNGEELGFAHWKSHLTGI